MKIYDNERCDRTKIYDSERHDRTKNSIARGMCDRVKTNSKKQIRQNETRHEVKRLFHTSEVI